MRSLGPTAVSASSISRFLGLGACAVAARRPRQDAGTGLYTAVDLSLSARAARSKPPEVRRDIERMYPNYDANTRLKTP